MSPGACAQQYLAIPRLSVCVLIVYATHTQHVLCREGEPWQKAQLLYHCVVISRRHISQNTHAHADGFLGFAGFPYPYILGERLAFGLVRLLRHPSRKFTTIRPMDTFIAFG